MERYKFLLEIALLIAGFAFFSYVLNANVSMILENQKNQIEDMRAVTQSLKDRARDHEEFKETSIKRNEILDKMKDAVVGLNTTLKILILRLEGRGYERESKASFNTR